MVTDVDPVAAVFALVSTLNFPRSKENIWVMLAVRSPTVKTIPVVPLDHRPDMQLNAESESQTVDSQPVREDRACTVCK
jgi:hypothetical protein